jgi:hypothetical protein
MDAPLFESGAPATMDNASDGQLSCIPPPAVSANKKPLLPYPPFSTADRIERGRQFRGMATAAYMLCGPHHGLWRLLRAAEVDAKALQNAAAMFDALPSLVARRIVSTFGAANFRGGRRDV